MLQQQPKLQLLNESKCCMFSRWRNMKHDDWKGNIKKPQIGKSKEKGVAYMLRLDPINLTKGATSQDGKVGLQRRILLS